MKKNFFAACTFLLSHYSYAFSGDVTIASDYIWRGISQSNNEPAVQASVVHEVWKGGELGGWASTLASGNGQELDISFNQTFSFNAIDFAVGVLYYHYNRLAPADTLEFVASVSAKGFSLAHYWAPEENAFATGSDNTTYSNLSYEHSLKDNWGVKLAVGWNDFDGTGSTSRDYADMEVRLNKKLSDSQSLYIGWTRTWRKSTGPDNLDEDNIHAGISWSF